MGMSLVSVFCIQSKKLCAAFEIGKLFNNFLAWKDLCSTSHCTRSLSSPKSHSNFVSFTQLNIQVMHRNILWVCAQLRYESPAVLQRFSHPFNLKPNVYDTHTHTNTHINKLIHLWCILVAKFGTRNRIKFGFHFIIALYYLLSGHLVMGELNCCYVIAQWKRYENTTEMS